MHLFLHLKGLLLGLLLAINDVISLGMTKNIYLQKGVFKNIFFIIIPMILYSFQIPLFYFGLSHTSLVILNLYWDILSDILVTMIGIFYFKESVNFLVILSLIFAFLSIILGYLSQYY